MDYLTKKLPLRMGAILTLLAAAPGIPAQAPGAPVIRVIAGDNSTTVLATRRSIRPVVAVTVGDAPAPTGTRIRFQLPEVGARAEFLDGTSVAEAATDTAGRVMAPEMRPLEVGSFELRVYALGTDPSAGIGIPQTIVHSAEAAGRSGEAANLGYRIEILEGDDGVNIVSKKTAVRTIVRVVDRNNLPVAAVPVVITLIALRGGGESRFPGGGTQINMITDANGTASAPPVDPSAAGTFELQVSATVNGATIGRVIGQTNFATETAALSAGKTPGASSGAEGSGSSAGNTSTATESAGSAAKAAKAGGAVATPSTGLSGVQLLGLVGGGLAAAGGIAQATGVFNNKEAAQTDCSGPISGYQSTVQSVSTCVQAARDPATQCRTQIQNFLNAMGGVCTCGGGTTAFPAELRSVANQLAQAYAQLGFAYPSSCR